MIRPVDLKMVIPKTQDMSKNEQNNQERLKFTLITEVDEQNQTIQKELKKVNDSEELSKSKIKDEKSKQDKDDQEKREAKERNTLESNMTSINNPKGNVGIDPNIGIKIDIKI